MLSRYFEKIKHPMDLTSMAYKLDNGHYANREAFQNDFNLLITNAKTYNQPGSLVYQESDKFKAFFERSMFRICYLERTSAHHLLLAWDQVNSTLATMNRNKADAAQDKAPEALSTPATDVLVPEPVTEMPELAEVPLLETPPVVETKPPKPPVEIVAKPREVPIKKEPSPIAIEVPAPTKTPPERVHTPAATATPIITPTPVKPTLKLKAPKIKVKVNSSPAPSADRDPSNDLDALLNSVPQKSEGSSSKRTVVEADLLLGELVDEIGVTAKPRETPSWSSKKKGKDRADGGQSSRRSLFSDGSSRQASPAIPAPSPAKLPPVPKRAGSGVTIKSREPVSDTHPIDFKRCSELIRYLTDMKTLPEVGWFLVPVDAEASGCPTYVLVLPSDEGSNN